MNIKFIDTPKPIGNFANVRFSGKYAYISGQGAFDDSGNLIIGKVGKDLNLDEGYEAARRVGITILSVINNDIGFDIDNAVDDDDDNFPSFDHAPLHRYHDL